MTYLSSDPVASVQTLAVTSPISLLVCALGGEGGGVLTQWLIAAAREAGFAAQSTSIPGVAQRTGATTYYIEVFPLSLRELGDRRPVLGLAPMPGALDALVSSELLETARMGSLGVPSPERTLVITSSARALTNQERMPLGDGRADTDKLLGVVRAVSREHHVLDMAELARASGTIVSAVMLGAIAGSALLPFKRAHYERVIRAEGASHAASLRGFAAGWQAVAGPREQAAMVDRLLTQDKPMDAVAAVLPPALARRFPQQVHAMLALGHARLMDYQGPSYAALYAERLAQVLQAEKEADPLTTHAYATTSEMARWLALWMAFDDIVRVAELKSRASRWQRIRAQTKSGSGDLLKVYDHFKPGVPEMASLLPTGLAGRLMAWDRRRQAVGKAPWAVPLKIASHSVWGMLSLRLLAACKVLRPFGSRYAQEQMLIGRWLDGVVVATRSHWPLGHEVALCGRLIKGYGSTHERGQRNLLHVIDYLAIGTTSVERRAQAVAAARTAALADEAGVALDKALREHGAPPRPVQAQPIRWMRRHKNAAR